MMKLCATIVFLMACGSRAPSGRDATTAPPDAAASNTDAADFAAVINVATAYTEATVAKDYAAMCATRVAAEITEWTRDFGSCEKAMEMAFASQPTDMLEGTRFINPRRQGELIAVDSTKPGSDAKSGTFYARREDGHWLLVDLPGDSRPPLEHHTSPVSPGTGPITPLARTDPDAGAAMKTVDAYIEAIVMRDFAGMCAARLAAERKTMAEEAGSCERGMEIIMRGQQVTAIAGSKAANPRRRGPIIAVDMQSANRKLGTLYLVAEAGAWLLIDMAAEDEF